MYFIWQIINMLAIIAAVVYIGKLIYNYKKFKLKSVSYFAVTLALLIVSNLIKDKTTKDVFILNNVNKMAKTQTVFDTQTIEVINATTFDISIQIQSIKNNSEVIPVKAVSTTNGFSYGFSWELKDISIEGNIDNTLLYKVRGSLEWNFLGIPFYEQSKVFVGTYSIEE